MKTHNKILIAILIILSLSLMTEMDVFHHHFDKNQHSECPLCVLNTVLSSVAILYISVIFFKPIFNYNNTIFVYQTSLIQNYSSYYYPDRAPPLA